MKEELKAWRLRSGKIDGQQYEGFVIEYGSNFYYASMHALPTPGTLFIDNNADVFTTLEAAEEFVINEWDKLVAKSQLD